MEQIIKNIMAKMLNINEDQINDETSPHTISTWDSVKHIELMTCFENEFKIIFDESEIPTMVNYAIIAATIQAHLDI